MPPPKKKKTFDVFKEIAIGLSRGKQKETIWEEIPVDVETFVTSREYLNLKWNGRTGCRPRILEIIKAICDDKVREALTLLGKGSGKDFLASIVHLYGIYKCLCMIDPQAYYGLAPGSPIYFINVARNEGQAKNVFFKQFVGMLNNCPWFHGKHEDLTGQVICFDKGITALSGNSQGFSWLGYNTLQWVGDELAFFLENDNDENSQSRAEECWEAAYGSCMTRFAGHYKMIGITTPRHEDDFTMKKFGELKGRIDGYSVQAATWDINPLQTKEDYKYALARNYRRTMRDFGAQPMGVIESFWSEPDFVEENVSEICRACQVYQARDINTDEYVCRDYPQCRANGYAGNGVYYEWLKPVEGVEYCMHFDLSKNKDRLAFDLGHCAGSIKLQLDKYEISENLSKPTAEIKLEDIPEEDRTVEKALIKIDAIGWISPQHDRDNALLKNKEIHYDSVLNLLILPLKDKGFVIKKITFDQYQSAYIIQKLTDLGFNVDILSCDRDDSVPTSAKNALTENRVEYPYDKLLCSEAKKLKYIKGKKVDHPEGGCFVGTQEVSLLDGRNLTFEQLVEEYGGNNKKFWVFSIEPNTKKIVPALAYNPRITKTVNKYIRIILDNGKIIESTVDHLFLLRNGEYIRADKLFAGSSLMPLYMGANNKGKIKSDGKKSKRYMCYRDLSEGNILRYVHLMVYKYFNPMRRLGNCVIHHINFDSTDNRIENLIAMGKKEHYKLHIKILRDRGVKPELSKFKQFKNKFCRVAFRNKYCLKNNLPIKGYQEYDDDELRKIFKVDVIKRTRSIVKKIMSENPDILIRRNKSISASLRKSKFNFSKHMKSICDSGKLDYSWTKGKNHYAYNKLVTLKSIKERAFLTVGKIAKALKCSPVSIIRTMRKTKYKTLTNLRQCIVENNHKVSSIEIIHQSRKMYDISVEKYSNFALSAGVFVHNSKDVWDSTAGTIFNCEEDFHSVGCFEEISTNDED